MTPSLSEIRDVLRDADAAFASGDLSGHDVIMVEEYRRGITIVRSLLSRIEAQGEAQEMPSLSANLSEANENLREALTALVGAVTEEVNAPDHRGGSGNLLARLSDARAALSGEEGA